MAENLDTARFSAIFISAIEMGGPVKIYAQNCLQAPAE